MKLGYVLSLAVLTAAPLVKAEAADASGAATGSAEAGAAGLDAAPGPIGVRFARSGQLVLSLERTAGLFFESLSVTYTQAGAADTQVTESATTTNVGVFGMTASTPSSVPRVALDYALTNQITVGGALMYTLSSHGATQRFDDAGRVNETSQDAGSTSFFVVEPRVGYVLPFGRAGFGVWPRAGAQVAFIQDNPGPEAEAAGSLSSDTTTVSLTLQGLFFWTPIRSVLFLGGPVFDWGLFGTRRPAQGDSQDATLTSFGLWLGLGAYF